MVVHEHRRVARERRRIARDVDDPLRRAVAGQRLDERDRAFARRIDQDLVERTQRFEAFGRRREQVGDVETWRCPARPFSAAFSVGPVDERSAAFDADDRAAAARDAAA